MLEANVSKNQAPRYMNRMMYMKVYHHVDVAKLCQNLSAYSRRQPLQKPLVDRKLLSRSCLWHQKVHWASCLLVPSVCCAAMPQNRASSSEKGRYPARNLSTLIDSSCLWFIFNGTLVICMEEFLALLESACMLCPARQHVLDFKP